MQGQNPESIPITIDFRKDGFVTVQRQVQPAWQDWAVVDDIVMTPLDTVATAIDLSGTTTAWQVHRSSMQSDADGTRRAMLLFPPAVTGELRFADGSTAALARCTVRVTEVTVGPMGEAAMPAELPPTSNYTYAASFDCDEALAAGTEHTEFSPSLPLYVENFLGFPVGIEVPYGVYDSARGVWEGEPNGVVLRVTSITGQMADLDLDSGDGGDAQADPELYATYGISDGEREVPVGKILEVKLHGQGPPLLTIRRAGRAFNGRPGTPIFIGDEILTGPDTFAVIDQYSGGRVGINKNTTVRIESETQVRYDMNPSWKGTWLKAGRVYNKMSKRGDSLEIETNGGVMCIKG
ncbi:MAG: hypothetical protein KatS3mg077_3016 [Candidatus Binatia bacterium]|nr:MAG: hypothetical protein KatS3mg077_3016 [Candidatus Binatia bacterium]